MTLGFHPNQIRWNSQYTGPAKRAISQKRLSKPKRYCSPTLLVEQVGEPDPSKGWATAPQLFPKIHSPYVKVLLQDP